MLNFQITARITPKENSSFFYNLKVYTENKSKKEIKLRSEWSSVG